MANCSGNFKIIVQNETVAEGFSLLKLTGERLSGVLGPAACRGSYGSAPTGASRRQPLDGASRRALCAGSLRPSFFKGRNNAWLRVGGYNRNSPNISYRK